MSRNIVLVEDEMVVGLEIRKTLERLGYSQVEVFKNGSNAVQHNRENPVDLILMDIRLEGAMDGIEATEKIHETTETPVVFVTSYSDDETVERVKKTDAHGYILKPFEKDDLDKAVSHALDEADQATELDNGALFFRAVWTWLFSGTGSIDTAPALSP